MIRTPAHLSWIMHWPLRVAVSLLACVIVICPIFDYDLYWHLAYGREMWNSGTIIQYEPFSFTAEGTPFNNRSWLAQWLLYGVQHHGGWHALLALKLVITSAVALFMFQTALYLGAVRGVAAVAVLLGILAGHYRYTERPEIFTLLLLAMLSWVLAGWRTGRLTVRWLWLIPPTMLVWDWLHGSVYGAVLLGMVVVLENVAVLRASTFAPLPPVSGLNRVAVVTLVVMLANPLGIATYWEFFGHLAGVGNAAVVNNSEYFPLSRNPHDYASFIFLAAIFFMLGGLQWRILLLPQAIVALAFVMLATQINRVTGVAAIAAAPVVALLVSRGIDSGAAIQKTAVAGLLLMVAMLVGDGLHHKVLKKDSPRALGWHVDDQFFPAGGARLVRELAIRGNMFNTGHIGGYLAWALYPERKVFHYNNGPTFGDPYRFWGRPDLLSPYDIDYAFIAHEAEFELFPVNQWARIYRDPAAALVVKRTPENAELIALFELRHFHPMMNAQQLDRLAMNYHVLSRLLDEMAVYLAYRKDDRMAREFARLVRRSPAALDSMLLRRYLDQATGYHPILSEFR